MVVRGGKLSWTTYLSSSSIFLGDSCILDARIWVQICHYRLSNVAHQLELAEPSSNMTELSLWGKGFELWLLKVQKNGAITIFSLTGWQVCWATLIDSSLGTVNDWWHTLAGSIQSLRWSSWNLWIGFVRRRNDFMPDHLATNTWVVECSLSWTRSISSFHPNCQLPWCSYPVKVWFIVKMAQLFLTNINIINEIATGQLVKGRK